MGYLLLSYIETRSSSNICACARSSVIFRRRGRTPTPGVLCLVVYVSYFRFMDDVMFASNAPSYIATRKGHVLKTVPRVAASGAKFAIFDCLVCCRFVYVNPQHVQTLCVCRSSPLICSVCLSVCTAHAAKPNTIAKICKKLAHIRCNSCNDNEVNTVGKKGGSFPLWVKDRYR